MQTRVVLLVVLLALLLGPVMAWATMEPSGPVGVVPIEGRLVLQAVYHKVDGVWEDILCLESMGSSDTSSVLPLPAGYALAGVSPLEDHFALARCVPGGKDGMPLSQDLFVMDPDGSNLVSITGPTGLGGVNCPPIVDVVWSPDGTRLLFWNWAVFSAEQWPCQGTQTWWLINADGTGLVQILPPWTGIGGPRVFWMPNGRLFVWMAPGTPEESCYLMNVDGTGVEPVPTPDFSTKSWAGLSRDGQWFMYRACEPGEKDGQPGVFNRLCISRMDGRETRELVQNFISCASVQAVWEAQEDQILALFPSATLDFAKYLIVDRSGPLPGAWSPNGDRLVFTGAGDLDPEGPYFPSQSEAWMYDLATGQVTQLTDDDMCQWLVIWEGHNTSSNHSDVSVDNTTVAFEDVTSHGLTNILVNTTAPALPSGEDSIGFVYNIKTTAGIDGLITVEMTYRDADLPSGTAEADLSIYHYDSDVADWVDITTSRDPVNNVITGVTDSLSPFGMVAPLRFSDVGFRNWAHSEIQACVAAGIVNGYPDGTYLPTLTVTRDQMAVFVSRALAGGESQVPTPPALAHFPDVATDHWAYKHVEYAYAHNIVAGYPDGKYWPGLAVDRGQMAVFMARAIVTPLGEEGLASYTPPTTPSFSDVATGFWSFKHIEYLKGRSIVQGYPDGKYHPELAVTRDQMAVYVTRAFGL